MPIVDKEAMRYPCLNDGAIFFEIFLSNAWTDLNLVGSFDFCTRMGS